MITWQWRSFEALTRHQLYDVLTLRQRVFMLEQKSLYLDLDGEDSLCFHLLGVTGAGELAAYLRLIPPSGADTCVHLGRIVVAPAWRGRGLGRDLIERGLSRCRADWPSRLIAISAQHHLVPLYRQFGFVSVGEPYDDGGVLHIDMHITP